MRLPQILVANGGKSRAVGAVKLKLSVDSIQLEEQVFFIIPDLPVTLIVGNPACKAWNALICWKDFTIGFAEMPAKKKFARSKRHWRGAFLLLANQDEEIPPGNQKFVGFTQIDEEEWGSVEGRYAIVKPQLFPDFLTMGSAGEKLECVSLVNPTNKTISIRKGQEIGRLFPRLEEDFQVWNKKAECNCGAVEKIFLVEEQIEKPWQEQIKEAPFDKIKLDHIRTERSEERIAKLLLKHKNIFSQGNLDYTSGSW